MSDLAARAEAFARAVHFGQTRKGAAAEPYATHLEEVAGFVRRHGGDDLAIAVAWLHDTVEDCRGVTDHTVRTLFGAQVADLVAELTDDKNLEKARRKQLQISNAHHKSPRAALVKLGDKTSNVRALGVSPPADWSGERKRDYVEWAETVVAALPATPVSAYMEFSDTAKAARQRLAGDAPAAT
jgi:(p)ppGpp synthase/HD superfamily hydrolase